MSNKAARRARGFTLLELTVVLFILMLATVLVAPAFSRSFGQTQLKAAARDIAAVCRLARAQAIANQYILEVVVDRQTNRYWLRGPDWIVGRLGGIDRVETVEDPEQPWLAQIRQARVRSLPSGVSLTSVLLATGPLPPDERGVIAFFPQGSSSGGSIDLADGQGRGYRIVVEASIGSVRIRTPDAA